MNAKPTFQPKTKQIPYGLITVGTIDLRNLQLEYRMLRNRLINNRQSRRIHYTQVLCVLLM